MFHTYPYVLGLIKLFIYKLFYGARLNIKGLPRLSGKASLRVRKNSRLELSDRSYIAEGTLIRVTQDAHFHLGKNSGFNSYCVITCRDKIHIGDDVICGPFVTIHDHEHDYHAENIKSSGYVSKPIVIEDNVWIGGNVVILKGVTIGTGSVIAAGSIVAKDVPPHTIVYNKVERVEKSIAK